MTDRARTRFGSEGFDAIVADVTQPEHCCTNLPAAETAFCSPSATIATSEPIDRRSLCRRRAERAGRPAGRVRAASSTSAPPASTARPAANGSTKRRRPIRSATAAGRRWRPRSAGRTSARRAKRHPAAWPASTGRGAFRLSTSFAPANRFPHRASGYLNLIHVDDAADSRCWPPDRCEPFDNGPRIYCVSDGHPVERGEFYQRSGPTDWRAAAAFVEPDPNSPRAARAEANRRVRNDADAR